MKVELEIDETELAKKIAEEVLKALQPSLLASKGRQPEEDFLDVPSLAAFLKVDVGWIYQRVHQRAIPFYKIGKYTRFKRPEIEAWVEQNRAKKSLGKR